MHLDSRWRWLATTLFALVLPMFANVAPVAAANNVTVLAFYGDCLFSGAQAGATRTVKVEWRNVDGDLKSKQSVTSNASGQFATRCELGEEIEAGDTLKTTIGTSSRTVTVPRLTLNAERDNDEAYGKSDPGADVLVYADTFNGGFDPNNATETQADTFVAGNGSWDVASGDWSSPTDLRGYDLVTAIRQTTHGDQFVRQLRVMAMEVVEKSTRFYIRGNPGQDSITTLNRSSSDIASGHVFPNQYGAAIGEFIDSDNLATRALAGDVVTSTFSPDASITLPTITMAANKSTDVVTVNCGPTAHGVLVHAYTRDFLSSQTRVGTSNGAGSLTVSFATAPKFNIVSGSKIDVLCKFPSGDIAARSFTVP